MGRNAKSCNEFLPALDVRGADLLSLGSSAQGRISRLAEDALAARGGLLEALRKVDGVAHH